jgi:hypothetical protein
VLVTEMYAVEIADRQGGAACGRKAAHLLTRELAHRSVSAQPPGFL